MTVISSASSGEYLPRTPGEGSRPMPPNANSISTPVTASNSSITTSSSSGAMSRSKTCCIETAVGAVSRLASQRGDVEAWTVPAAAA